MNTIEQFPQHDPFSEPPKWPDNPFVSICLKPRQTIRAIVKSNPEKYITSLAVITGICEALDEFITEEAFDDIWFVGVLIALVAGPFIGILSLHIGSAFQNWIAHQFGGIGSALEMRAVIAWSSVPIIVSAVLWIPHILIVSISYAVGNPSILDTFLPLFIIFGLIDIVMVLWSFYIYIQCFAEVQGFSGWKAFGVSIVPIAVLVLFLFGCALLAGGL